MNKVLSAPGKTFLVGEYLALVGGPSILLATQPQFVFTEDVTDDEEAAPVHPFAPQSPAGKFITRHDRDFRGLKFQFQDPHVGAGGLGASSAQWAFVYALKYGVPANDEAIASMLEEYRQCAWNGEGVAPSGADVVAQMNGGVTCFDGREFKTQTLGWNFEKLSFTLIRTGVKLATHEHLKRHQAAPQDILRACVGEAREAFASRNEDLLVAAVARYASALFDTGRTAPHTVAILEKLLSEPWVRAAKGCGAMGADVVLILHNSEDAPRAREWALKAGLPLCGDLATLGSGLSFDSAELEGSDV